MKMREVLKIQGQVFVINARGQRRALHPGDRLAATDRLELGEGSELTLRDADGHEERLHGAEPLSAAILLADTGWLQAASARPLPSASHSREPKRLARALMDHAQPEAGLLSESGVGTQHNGHDFVRIERAHLPVPRSALAASSLSRWTQDERMSVPHGTDEVAQRLIEMSSLKDAGPAERTVAQPVSPSCIARTVYLLEGADRISQPSPGRYTGLSQQRVTLSSPLWAADGRRLLSQPGDYSSYDSDEVDPSLHQVVDDQHVTLQVDCVAILPGESGGASRYEYLLTHRGRMSMENIPEEVEVASHWRIRARDGAALESTAVTIGNVDHGIGQVHCVIENDPVMPGAHDPEIEEIDEYGRPVFPESTPHAVLAAYLSDPERMLAS